MSSKTLTKDMSVKVPIDQVWEAFKNLHHLLPRLLPGFVISSAIVDGPVHGGVGSVRECRFSSDVPGISLSNEKIEVVDDVQHIFAYSVTEGEVLQKFSSYRVKWQFTPQVAGIGTDVKWTAEVVPKSEEAEADGKNKASTTAGFSSDSIYEDSALLLVKQLEGHLIVTKEYSQPSPKEQLREELLFG